MAKNAGFFAALQSTRPQRILFAMEHKHSASAHWFDGSGSALLLIGTALTFIASLLGWFGP